MAVNLKMNVTVKGQDDASKTLDKVSESAQGLSEDSKKLNSEIERLGASTGQLRDQYGKFATQEQAQLARALAATAGASKDSANQMEATTAALEAYTGAIEDAASGTIGFVDVVSGIGGAMVVVKDAVVDLTHMINNLIGIFRAATDPAFINRLQKVTYILGNIAKFKGYKALGDGLLGASSELEKYGSLLESLGFSSGSFDQSLEGIANKIQLLTSAISAFGMVIDGALIGSLGFIALDAKVGVPLLEVGKSFKKLTGEVGSSVKLIGAYSSELTQELTEMKFGDSLRKALVADANAPIQASRTALVKFSGDVKATANQVVDSVSQQVRMLPGFAKEAQKVSRTINLNVGSLDSLKNATRLTADQFEEFGAKARAPISSLIPFVAKAKEVGFEVLDAKDNVVAFSQYIKGATVPGNFFDPFMIGFMKFKEATDLRNIKPLVSKLITETSKIFGRPVVPPDYAVDITSRIARPYAMATQAIAKFGEAADIAMPKLAGIGRAAISLGRSLNLMGAAMNIGGGALLFGPVGAELGAAIWLTDLATRMTYTKGQFELFTSSVTALLGKLLAPMSDVARFFAQSAVSIGQSVASIENAIGRTLARTFFGFKDIVEDSLLSISDSFVRFRTIATISIQQSNLSVVRFAEQIRQRFINIGIIFRNMEDPVTGFVSNIDRMKVAFVAFRVSFKPEDIAKDFKTMSLSIAANARLSFNVMVQSAFESGRAVASIVTESFARSSAAVSGYISNLQTARLVSSTLIDNRVYGPMVILQDQVKVLSNSFKVFGNESSKSFADMGTSVVNSTKKAATGLKNIEGGMRLAAKETGMFVKGLFTLHSGPTLLSLAEHATILQAGLFALGQGLLLTESKMLEFAGMIAIVSSILLGGFALAIRASLDFLGDLATSVGSFLMDKMTLFEEKFQKAQVAVEFFNFTLAGYRREVGASVGTTEEWTKVIRDLAETTLFSEADLQKSAAEIIAVGNAIGLTKDQQKEMLRLVPEHLKAGDNVFDATVAFVQALQGAGQGVLKYGLHVNDAAINHTKFAHELGVMAEEMNDAEKAQARFASLIEQSAPKMGLAASQVQTIAGSTIMLDKALTDVMIKLGQSSDLTVMFYNSLSRLARTFLMLPDEIWSVVGTLQDFLGVSLKIVGVILKMALPIVSIVFAYNLFNLVVTKSIIAQTALTKVFWATNTAVGAQSVAVVSLATVWANFQALLIGIVAKSLVAIKGMLIGATSAIWGMTKAILANPLFWKAAAIVAAILVIVKAFKELENRTKIFSSLFGDLSDGFKSASGASSFFSRSIKWLADVLSGVFMAAVNAAVATIAVAINAFLGLYEATLLLAKGLGETMNFLSPGGGMDLSWIDQEMARTETRIASLSSTANDAAALFLGFGDNVAYASEKAADSLTVAMEQAKTALASMKRELVSETQRELIGAEVLGFQNQALILRKRLTEEKLLAAKEKDEKQRLTEELLRIDAEIQKATRDTVTESDKALRELYLKELERTESIANIQKAAQVRLEAETEPFREQLQNLSFLPPTEETARAMESISAVIVAKEKSITQDTAKQIDELKKKQEEEASKRAREEARRAKEILSQRKALAEEIARASGDETAVIMFEYEKQADTYKKMLDEGTIDAQQYYDALVALNKNTSDKMASIATEAAKKQTEAYTSAMQTAGNTYEVIRLQTEAAISEQVKAFREGYISFEEFEKAKTAIKAAEEEKRRATTGDETLDKQINTTASFIESAKSGISSIISKIGAMYGPIGSLIAGIINFFNMGREEFAKMIDALLQSIIDLPANLAANIPTFIQKVIEAIPASIRANAELLFGGFTSILINAISLAIAMLPELIKDILSPRFWLDIGKSMFKSLVQAFKNLWAAIFGGTVIVDAIKPAVEKAKVAFGAAGADAGGGEFKVRDLAMAEDRAAQTFEDRVETTTEITGKGLLGYIADGVKEIIDGILGAFGWVFDQVSDFAVALADGVANSIQWAVDGMISFVAMWWDSVINATTMLADVGMHIFDFALEQVEIVFGALWDSLKAVFDFGASLLGNTWETAKGVFSGVVDAFKAVWELGKTILLIPYNLFMAMWNFVKNIFDDPIWAFKQLWQDIKNIFSDIFSAFQNVFSKVLAIGQTIWDGFVNAAKAAWNFVSDIGSTIWGAIKSGFSSVTSFFADVGATVWKSITDALSGFGTWLANLFTGLGTTVWNAITSGLSGLGDWFAGLFKLSGMNRDNGVVEKFLGLEFPWVEFAQGGIVPGTARVGGDSPANDIVPALLSPGEIVVPRSIVKGGENSILNFLKRVGPDKELNGKAGEVLNMFEDMGIEPLKRSFFDDVGEKLKGIWGSLSSGAQDIINYGASLGGQAWETIKGLPASVLNAIANLSMEIINAAKIVAKMGGNINWLRLPIDPVGVLREALSGATEIFKGPLSRIIGGKGSVTSYGVPARTYATFNDWLLSKDYMTNVSGQITALPPSNLLPTFPPQPVATQPGNPPPPPIPLPIPGQLVLSPGLYNKGGVVESFRQSSALANHMRAAGVQRFANGGFVQGPSGVDNVPALLTPGEYVLPVREVRRQQREGSEGNSINLTFNIAPGANMSEQQLRREVIPVVIDEIRRQSKNGNRILSPKGVYD